MDGTPTGPGDGEFIIDGVLGPVVSDPVIKTDYNRDELTKVYPDNPFWPNEIDISVLWPPGSTIENIDMAAISIKLGHTCGNCQEDGANAVLLFGSVDHLKAYWNMVFEAIQDFIDQDGLEEAKATARAHGFHIDD